MSELVLGADIGGTKTFFALVETQSGQSPRIVQMFRYANDDFPLFADLLRRLLRDHPSANLVRRACFGIAGPQERGCVNMTNRDWVVDAAEASVVLNGAPVRLANDFEVAAYGIDLLKPADLLVLQAGQIVHAAPQVVIGPGTGLGIAYRIWTGERYQILPGEGGHMGFAPNDPQQAALWQAIFAVEGRVSAERVVSGAGLAHIYEFISTSVVEPAEVSRRALDLNEPQALQALDIFAACLGSVAGDHALNALAYGGVFLAGGIAPRLRDYLQASGLLAAFNKKGRHTKLAQRMPVHLVLNEHLGLLGASLLAARA